MSNLLRSLISGGSKVARGVDDAAAVRHLDDLMKAERYIDQVKHLDEFYGRTPSRPPPVVYVAPRAPSTAEQFLAAGIPMPSAARRLADAADDAAAAGLGPDNALLREWVDSQVPLPSATPRGSQRTAIEAIGDSWDTQLRREALAPLEARRRRADLLSGATQLAGDFAGGVGNAARGAAGAAGRAASGLGRGVAGAVTEMGPLPLAATGVGTVAAIAATRAARQQQEQLLDRQAREARQRYLLATPDQLFDPVATDIGFADDEQAAAVEEMLRAARGSYRGMIPSRKFDDIITTLDDPLDRVPLSFDAFSDSDLVEEFKPRPRMPQGAYR
jgi:hypothetical protein